MSDYTPQVQWYVHHPRSNDTKETAVSSSTGTGIKDEYGVEFRIGDRVMVVRSGNGATGNDVRRIGTIVKRNRTRFAVDFAIGDKMAAPKTIGEKSLVVMTRGGQLGFEGMYSSAANKRGPAKPHQRVGTPRPFDPRRASKRKPSKQHRRSRRAV